MRYQKWRCHIPRLARRAPGSRAWSLVVLWLLVSHVPSSLAAGVPDPGTRVRLTARIPERQTWTGPLVSVGHDSVAMHTDGVRGARVAIPTLHVERFEVSQGLHSNVGRGALSGFTIGGLLGGALAYYVLKDTYYAGSGALGGAALGGAIGAAIGAWNESGSTTERWRKLPAEEWRNAASP